MTGQHIDRYVQNSTRTEDNDGVDAIISSPTTTDEPILIAASSDISLTTMITIPVTKNSDLHQLQHYHLHQRHQRQGNMYDQTKDLMEALPPEILDHILLSLDRSTLLQCSVLSRRWSRRVMPHLWYRPWMKYYISWMMLVQTVSGARSGGSGRGGSGGSGQQRQQQQQQRDGGLMMRNVGSNPQPLVAVGLGLTQQGEQEQQQHQDDDKEEREVHAGGGRGGIISNASLNSREQGEATTTTTTRPSPFTLTKPPPLAPITYGALINILDFSHLHYILSDTFLSHLLPHTPFLQQLIVDSPKQFSSDSLFTLAEYCCNLVRLELLGCAKVSDKGMEAVFEKCWKLRTVVLSNVVGGGGEDGGVGNSSKASSSNHSLTLTHKTLDHLAVNSSPSKDSTKTTTIVRKLHTLNLANGLRFPTSGEIDPVSSQSLTNLLRTYSTTLVSLNLSFCGPAVTDTLLLQFSSTVRPLPLQHLNIAFCFEATDIGLVSLSKACPDLQVLDITGLTQVSDMSILAIGQRCMKFRQLVMVDERHRSNPGGSVGGGGGGGQWSSQSPLITDEILNRFPWGVRVVQRRDELLGQRKSPRIF